MPGCKFIFRAIAIAIGLALVHAATPALADAIDGHWCNAGKSMTIDGPTVVTPGGNKIQGNYSRHDFDYIIPESEPGAGTKVDATLLNEDEMQVTSKTTPKPVTWKRCQITS